MDSPDNRCNSTMEDDSPDVMEEKFAVEKNCSERCESQGACNVEADQPKDLTKEHDKYVSTCTMEDDSSHVAEEQSIDGESQGACNIEADQQKELSKEQGEESHYVSDDSMNDNKVGDENDSRNILDAASSSMGCLDDVLVDIPINKAGMEGETKCNLPDHEKQSEGSLHDDNEALCLIKSTQISKNNQTVKAARHDVPEEVHCAVPDSEALLHKFPKGHSKENPDLAAEESLKEQNKATLVKTHEHVLEAGVQKSVINIYITWTDNETGDNRTLNWSHQNCDVCYCNFTAWKQHVVKEHEALEEKVQSKSSRKLRIPKKVVKTEPLM
ncbi:uncharacterized protein [Amphiura filiformis]|uniref:uncharacterized protein n=1 Tax=Amphiura filiformis TaxID=82378 RepID=UPI003B218BFD